MSITQPTSTIIQSSEELIRTVVIAVTGFSVDELPEPTKSKMIKQCSDMLVGYIINYVKIHHGEQEAMQFKGLALNDTFVIMQQNPQFASIFLEAFDSFIETLH